MLDEDMMGNADARLDIAAKSATVDMALCNQLFDKGSIAYMLDDGGMKIATSWQFDDHEYPCSDAACTLGVVFRVVGMSEGCYSPSWKSNESWHVVPLPHPKEIIVQYTLRYVAGSWKIDRFPPPFVSKNTMRRFFEKEIMEMEKVRSKLPANIDPRAIENVDVIIAWGQQQLSIIEKLAD